MDFFNMKKFVVAIWAKAVFLLQSFLHRLKPVAIHVFVLKKNMNLSKSTQVLDI